jgi:hypothetical protein
MNTNNIPYKWNNFNIAKLKALNTFKRTLVANESE